LGGQTKSLLKIINQILTHQTEYPPNTGLNFELINLTLMQSLVTLLGQSQQIRCEEWKVFLHFLLSQVNSLGILTININKCDETVTNFIKQNTQQKRGKEGTKKENTQVQP
jgi:hypothetical protein